MANEVTSTSITEAINSEWITPAFMDAAKPHLVALQHCRQFDLRGRSSAKVAVPNVESSVGTPSSGGTSVDTEFDATEGTDLSNTALTLAEVTITAAEYGVMRTITDTSIEDAIDGFDLIMTVVADNAEILMTALEDDVCALFASLSNSVGTSGSDMTLANLDQAIIGPRTRGVRFPAGLVGVLDDEQANNFEVAVTAANSSTAVYDRAASEFMGIQRAGDNGSSGLFARYKNVDLYSTGLTDTANTAADVVGAVFVPSRPGQERQAAFGWAVAREPRIETERNASLRATEVVTTMRSGVGELLDAAGTAIITDAPA